MTHVYGCANQMMLYGCRNQEHMLLGSRPEDVVQMLHGMYSFRFYAVSRQQPPVCKWLWGVKMWHGLIGTSAFPIEVQMANDTMTHHFLLNYCPGNNALVTQKLPAYPSWRTKGLIPQFPCALHFHYIKVFLVHFPLRQWTTDFLI